MTTEPFRLLVCGGREYRNGDMVRRVLHAVSQRFRVRGLLVIHGGARGADTLAHDAACGLDLTVLVYMANWQRDGNAGGHIRNARMLAEGKPELCIAFPGGRGTADMARRCRLAGVTVFEVNE